MTIPPSGASANETRFRNRTEAGKLLANKLTQYANRSDVLVFGIPRGGVPVAVEVARALNAPLDICLVRKLGVPGNPELAMGAIAAGGFEVLNEDLLDWLRISGHTIAEVGEQELQELQRRDRIYRGDRLLPTIHDSRSEQLSRRKRRLIDERNCSRTL
jgi:putative phosphoribosyl transferase